MLIYNRLGRKIFESEYDNHPWNGKLENGRKCKEGTYYYKMDYVLNPFLAENEQNMLFKDKYSEVYFLYKEYIF